MIDPNKKISNPGAGLKPPVNRKPVVTTTVRGSDVKGFYTDTNTNQADDMYPGTTPAHTANAWFNGLTQAQKNAHNALQRAKDLAAAKALTIKGAATTNRVYDPVPVKTFTPLVKPAPVKSWTNQTTVMPFGSTSSRGTTMDSGVIAAGVRKNMVDIKGVDSKRNTFSAVPYTAVENKLDKYGQLRISDSPYVPGDTTGRGAGLKSSLIDVELKRSKYGTALREEGGKMTTRTMKYIKPKPVIIAKKFEKGAKTSGCGCDGAGKMETGGAVKKAHQPQSKDTGKESAKKSFPFGKKAPNAEQAKKTAGSAASGGKPRAHMFSRGGGVPDIDEESPIRYR